MIFEVLATIFFGGLFFIAIGFLVITLMMGIFWLIDTIFRTNYMNDPSDDFLVTAIIITLGIVIDIFKTGAII